MLKRRYGGFTIAIRSFLHIRLGWSPEVVIVDVELQRKTLNLLVERPLATEEASDQRGLAMAREYIDRTAHSLEPVILMSHGDSSLRFYDRSEQRFRRIAPARECFRDAVRSRATWAVLRQAGKHYIVEWGYSRTGSRPPDKRRPFPSGGLPSLPRRR